MDYAALKEYVLSKPEFADDIAAGVDWRIAESITSTTTDQVGSISRARFSIWCGATGLRAAVADHANDPASPLRSIALTIQDFLLGGVADSLDLSHPNNQMMLGAWVAADAITQDQAADLVTLATTQVPIFGNVHHLDVAKALRG